MFEFIFQGGLLVIPIALCSVIALTLFFERLYSLRRALVLPDEFVDRIEDLVKEDRNADALLLCQERQNPAARVLAVALKNAKKPRTQIKEVVDEVGQFEAAGLERYVEVIGTIAGITPLLGLLGTVLGMIQVFKEVEVSGMGDPSVFASGIWEALISTAVGLSVAIPSFVFYRYLQGRVDTLVVELEERALRTVDLIAGDTDELS